MKWIKLIGMAVGVTVLILLINHFTYKPKVAPPPPIKPVVETVAPAPIEPEPEKRPEPEKKPEREWNITGTKLPPRPEILKRETDKKRSEITPETTTTGGKTSKTGGGNSGGTGGTGNTGGGNSGGSAGGTSGGTSGGTDVIVDDDPGETTDPSYWYQTGEDPAGRTNIGDRHRKGCPKYMNVPGRAGTAVEGNPCPICGG